jgi:hypothetical protein
MVALALAVALSTGCAGQGGTGAQPQQPQQPHGQVSASPPAIGNPASAGNITGVVTDAAGKPLAGVMVQAISLDKPPQPVPDIAVLTDDMGRYTWSLQPGKYELVAGGAKATVTVPAGAGVQADLKAQQ